MTEDTEVATVVDKMSPQMLRSEPPSTVYLMHTMSSRAKLGKDGKRHAGGLQRDLQKLCLKPHYFTLSRSAAAVELQVLPQCVPMVLGFALFFQTASLCSLIMYWLQTHGLATHPHKGVSR